MQRRFVTLDVFTGRRFAGNPLAVVLDAEGLDTAAMQAIAREFNHPETVFILPPAQPANRARLRIFTPVRELPFAGHPTVGTAVLLGLRMAAARAATSCWKRASGRSGARSFQMMATAGAPALQSRNCQPNWGWQSTTQTLPRRCICRPRTSALASFASVALVRRSSPSPSFRWQASMPSGNANPIPPGSTRPSGRAGRFTSSALRPPSPAMPSTRACLPPPWVFRRTPRPDRRPLPSPASLPFARPVDGEHRPSIEQGYEMGRPSLIELAIVVEGGKLTAASIGGDAIIVTTGTIEA